jgi:TldD protein
MSRMNRRKFLQTGSASLGGALIAGSLAERVLGRVANAAALSGAEVGSGGASLVGHLATVVADLERKFPYASALVTGQSGVAMSRDRNGRRVSQNQNPTRGASLRVFDGASFHEAAVGDVSPDGLQRAAKGLLRDVSVVKERYRIERLPALEQTWKTQGEIDPASVSLADRMERLEKEYARVNMDDPRVRSVRVSTEFTEMERVFVDRTRRLASMSRMVQHSALLFGFDKGKPGFGFARRVGQGGLELAQITDAELEKMRKRFAESFGTEQVPAGEYEVVFAPPVSGLLAHESFGHGVEMDQFVKERAKAREFLGKPVASSIVSLLDDPSIAGARGSYPFDDEGMLAQPTTIIENGVFVRPLTDLMSATFLGKPRTPNGRAQSWDRKVYARMSNTFIARGTSTPEEVLASLKDGLYLEGFQNGIEDPQGWGIQFTAATAREVKGGKFTGKLFAPATVTGYVPDILSKITMVANDFELEAGTCGKGHKEFVPVTSGGPHLRTRARVS